MWPAADCGDCSSAGGAVPATIAVLGGVPHVGLTQQQLEHIAQRGLAVRYSPEYFPVSLHSVMQALAVRDLDCTTPCSSHVMTTIVFLSISANLQTSYTSYAVKVHVGAHDPLTSVCSDCAVMTHRHRCRRPRAGTCLW